MKDFSESTSLHATFHLPLSPEAFDEVRGIQTIARLQPSTTSNDIWHYIWGKPDFKAADYYKFCFREMRAHPLFRLLWNSKCTMKIKDFGWLLLHDRLNTRNMLKRRHYNIGDDLNCLLCWQNIEEMVDHMIFTYPFSRA